MKKEELIKLLERFAELVKESEIAKLYISLSLELTVKRNGEYYHYIYVCNNHSGKSVLCSVKGFTKLANMEEIETFNDVLEVLRKAKDE